MDPNHDYHLVKLQQGFEDTRERLRFAVTFAVTALNCLTLLNGGAIIGLFTFLGNAKGDTPFPLDPGLLWNSFCWFAIGLVCALVAHVGAYFSQNFFMQVDNAVVVNDYQALTGREPVPDQDGFRRAGTVAEYVGVAGGCFGVVAFVLGAWNALHGVLPQ